MTTDTGVLELEVVALRRESDGVLSIELADPQRRQLPEWAPGAHIDLGLPDHVRQYSLVGDPGQRHLYRIAVLKEPDSTGGSRYVHEELRPGELVEIGGPRNHFELIDGDRYVLVAGGVGITPLLPMIRRLHATEKDWHLTYCGRSRTSMAFLEELAAYGDHVTVHPSDEYGRIDLSTVLGEPDEATVVYSCGPEGLIAAIEGACTQWPTGALHVERFAAVARDDEFDLHPFDIVLARSGQRITVPANRSALDALDEVGIVLPSACRDGVCGSCQTKVLGGVPLHRDSLTDDDCTDQVMPCVSRAQTPELVLDL